MKMSRKKKKKLTDEEWLQEFRDRIDPPRYYILNVNPKTKTFTVDRYY